jgi:hypothetical protein
MRLALGWVLATAIVMVADVAFGAPIYIRDNPAGGVTSSGTPGGVFLFPTQSRPDGTTTGGALQDSPVGVFDLETSLTGFAPWESLYTFCLEPQQSVDGLPAAYTPAGLTGYQTLTATDIDWLERLWAAQFATTLTDSVNAAAFQFIIWELVVDTTVNLSADAVQLAGSEAAFALANLWITQLQGGVWTERTTLTALLSSTSQDFLIPGDPPGDVPVPEPASLVMVGTGLAAVAARLRRSRRGQ